MLHVAIISHSKRYSRARDTVKLEKYLACTRPWIQPLDTVAHIYNPSTQKVERQKDYSLKAVFSYMSARSV